MDTAKADSQWIREAVALLFLLREARRLDRLVRACSGDVGAALRVYRVVRHAEGVGDFDARFFTP